MPDAPTAAYSPPPLAVCPLTHAPLQLDPSGQFLITAAGIKYPLKDGIPILLPSAAIKPEPSLTPPARNS